MFVRNKQALFFTLFMPIIIMSIFGLIGFDSVPKIDVGYATTGPETQGTSEFIESLKKVETFNMHGGTIDSERQAITDGDRSVVFIIPSDLVPEKPDGKGRAITALVNVGDQASAGTAISIMNEFLNQANLQAVNAPRMFSLDVQQVDSKNLKYIDFLVPGIAAMALMQMSVFSVAFVFTDYKEKGILKRVLATPIKPMHFVAANVITRLIVAVVQTAILISVGVFIFHAHMFGSYWLLLLTVILGAMMFLGLGFTISGIAKTVESVPAIANLIVFPMLFLGGTFFPIDTMPDWLRQIVKFLPLQYLSDSIRQIMTQGAGFVDIQHDLLWMLAWSVVLVILANFTFGFEEKRM